ncbi:hypothetical protein AB0L14_05085 [Streptomyces sp. NPDC052727]|uniref:hypothetical protein n=1 Tax=Streptomyces sp. NPDC052727 TaxID=3154854 RepID=UPI0034414B09
MIAGEWLELVAWQGHGQPLLDGFGGAAATLPGGRVAGMAEGGSEVTVSSLEPLVEAIRAR